MMEAEADAVVVGNGIFGATIAKALTSAGRGVVVIDDMRPYRATLPSGGLMKPSWFSSLGKEVYDPSLELLDQVHGIEERQFTIPAGKRVKVLRVDSSRACRSHNHLVHDTVTDFDFSPGNSGGHVLTRSGVRYVTPLIVVATGAWASQLLPCPVQVKRGVSFQVECEPGSVVARIRPWAPYKQLVWFESSPGSAWVGDGSALKPESWTEERYFKTVRRCVQPWARGVVENWGDRPYVKGAKPCLLEERHPGLWLATGGSKNGTIAAGWCAHVILEATS